jgi:hypothetical protein
MSLSLDYVRQSALVGKAPDCGILLVRWNAQVCASWRSTDTEVDGRPLATGHEARVIASVYGT